jgi:hypothetical protein
MIKADKIKLYIALLHYPVLNKNGSLIASAITNLDLHDIARAAKTFGVKTFYVVTPYLDQTKMAQNIIGHWTCGRGGEYNPIRREALELIKIRKSFDDVIKEVEDIEKIKPVTVATCAKTYANNISYPKLYNMIRKDEPFILTFGTAWGLSKEFIENADYILESIKGTNMYNHLSVRSAVSIILDRLYTEKNFKDN